MPSLTDVEQKILAIERLHWSAVGFKEERVRVDLGMTMTTYTQALNSMLDDSRVEAADPLTVRRLRRVRDARLSAGIARSLSR